MRFSTESEQIIWRIDYDDMVLLFGKLPASERELFLDEARRDLVNHCESASFENLPVSDELPSNDPLTLAHEIVRRQQ